MITFQIRKNSLRHFYRQAEVIEVWRDGALIAAIYPSTETNDGVRIVSKYSSSIDTFESVDATAVVVKLKGLPG